LPEACRKWHVADIPAKDPRPCRLGVRGSVLLAVVATAPARVVAAAGSVLLMPVTRVDGVARVVGVVDTVMDGWGLVPRSSLVLLD
jgi:predicted enzyme related to lactoylglutathione lyase